MDIGKCIERVVNKIAQRLRIFDFFKFFKALVVFHALRFELVHAGIASLALLDAQNGIRIFKDAFAQGNNVKRVLRTVAVKLRECVQQVKRKRLVHGKVVLQVHIHAQVTVARRYGRHEFDNFFFDEALEQEECTVLQLFFAGGTFVAILEERAHGAAAVRRAAQNIQEHPVVHLETRRERFRC